MDGTELMEKVMAAENRPVLLAGIAIGGIAAYVFMKRDTGGLGVRSTTNSGSGGSAVYESARAVDEYLQFHFATPQELAPIVGPFVNAEALDFPALCARETTLACRSSSRGRVLDVGCATGRHSFELARDFNEVVGFDFSAAFIKACNTMKTQGRCEYKALVEGTNMETRTAKLAADIDTSKCTFVVGDACHMLDITLPGPRKQGIGTFDAVVAANLLCRLPDPKKFLRDMHVVVKPGGIFVLISPYSWLPEYTKKSEWLGGFTDKNGKPVVSKDEVRKALAGGFDFVNEKNMPFLIREHQRKYQIGCSHCMVFRRKNDVRTAMA